MSIENTGYVPEHLLNLVEGGKVEIPEDDYEPAIEEQLAALNGESLPMSRENRWVKIEFDSMRKD